MTKEQALQKQMRQIEDHQSQHRAVDVAARVAEHTYSDGLEDGVEYDYARCRKFIPMGDDIISIIEGTYAGPSL